MIVIPTGMSGANEMERIYFFEIHSTTACAFARYDSGGMFILGTKIIEGEQCSPLR